MTHQSNNDEDTRIVQLAGAWGGAMDFPLTKQQTLGHMEGGCWVYCNNHGPLTPEQLEAEWDIIGDRELRVLPALVGGRPSSPQEGEEE